MIIANPPSYVTAAQFQAMALDYDLSSYTATQLQDILNRASAQADAIMRRSLLSREETLRFLGDGTNRLELHVYPVLYLKKAQIVVPGANGPLIPIDQLLIDFHTGSLLEYTPMLWQGQGYFSRFPEGIPVDVTLGTGYAGFTLAQPAWSAKDASTSNGLAPGAYNVAVTTATMWGETAAVVRQVTTATGDVTITVNPVLGGYKYRAYISSAANNTTLTAATAVGATSFTLAAIGSIAVGDVLLFDVGANAEYLTVAAINGSTITTSTAALYAHAIGAKVIEQPTLSNESPFTAYGATALGIDVSSMTPPAGYWKDVLPLSDTSAPPLPGAITEAVRLLALMQLYEQNNLANRGVSVQRSGRKEISWKSTEGNSGKGVPLMMAQAMQLLKPYSLQGIF